MRALICLSLLLLSGCRLVPDRQSPLLPMAENWLNPGDAEKEPLKQWWRQIGDPQLDALVETARERNRDIEVAKARITEAQASRRSARSSLLPSFDLQGSATREQASLFSPGGVAQLAAVGISSLTQDIFELGFFAAWELDIFGQRSATLRGTEAQIRAAEADLDQILLVVSAEVASTYLALQGDQLFLQEAEAGIRSLEEKRAFDWQREEAGLLGEGSVAVMDTQVLAAQATLPPIRQRLRTQAYRLAVLLGEPPEAMNALIADSAAPAQRPLPAVQIGLRSELLRRRPDVRAAEERLQAAFHFDEASLAALFPKLNLTGSWGYQSTELRTFLRGDSDQYRFNSTVSQPIWQGGRLRAERDGALARTEQARADYEAVALLALEETENLLATYNGSEQAEQLQRQAADAADRARARSQKLLGSGLIDEQSALDSDYSYSQQKQALLQLETQRLLTWVSLQRALAGEL